MGWVDTEEHATCHKKHAYHPLDKRAVDSLLALIREPVFRHRGTSALGVPTSLAKESFSHRCKVVSLSSILKATEPSGDGSVAYDCRFALDLELNVSTQFDLARAMGER